MIPRTLHFNYLYTAFIIAVECRIYVSWVPVQKYKKRARFSPLNLCLSRVSGHLLILCNVINWSKHGGKPAISCFHILQCNEMKWNEIVRWNLCRSRFSFPPCHVFTLATVEVICEKNTYNFFIRTVFSKSKKEDKQSSHFNETSKFSHNLF